MKKTAKAKASRVATAALNGLSELRSASREVDQREASRATAQNKILRVLEECSRPVTVDDCIELLEQDIESIIWGEWDHGLEDIDLGCAMQIRTYAAAIQFLRAHRN